ncbi:hypothetical protein GCE9029_04665 [Grimontia celer]|uniref:Lipoprotein n=1 Tax=Grimontia celer TaxID=1796497 RepID=A0A128FDM7_9GAMM|nr:hypothetical protein [Grimontia celer]CZF84868.1 hypothetical protein GCE9029_04665 [Grimontia celer]
MNKIVIALFLSSLLAACMATKDSSPYKPTASSDDIAEAKEAFANNKYVDVDDNGFIVVSDRVPSGYKWEETVMRQVAYETACEKLKGFIDRGFVVNFWAKGRGGNYTFYNDKKCAEGAPTNL